MASASLWRSCRGRRAPWDQGNCERLARQLLDGFPPAVTAGFLDGRIKPGPVLKLDAMEFEGLTVRDVLSLASRALG